jgi:glutamate--cysteine ligase
MNSSFLKRLQTLDSPDWLQSLSGIKRGFEKECLRVNKQGMISQAPHPKALGSSLTHPMITTDFSEGLLEFITPPTEDLKAPFKILKELHIYANQTLKDEVLWSASMPCTLSKESDIPIAEYGSSNLGRLKHIYRRGLDFRYGRMMQTISGIHYNFSLSDSFWQKYYAYSESILQKQLFISEQYLSLIRNSLRLSWLLPLLFGASPAVSTSFFAAHKPDLEASNLDTYIGSFATSLRLSDLGYHNREQLDNKISYNTFTEFLETMRTAVHTSVPQYRQIGVFKEGEYNQLSDCVFQIEDEHYALVRPKRVSGREERMMAAILRDGIEYVEVRALDINPFVSIGVEQEMVYLLDAYLLYCLLIDSPPLTDVENHRIEYNHNQVVKWGRQPKLSLIDEQGKPRELVDWAMELLTSIEAVAALLDKAYGSNVFTTACKIAKSRVLAPDTLPSARVLTDIKIHEESYFDFASRWSLKHQQDFRNQRMLPLQLDYYNTLAKDSLLAQRELENTDTVSFDKYLGLYLAT